MFQLSSMMVTLLLMLLAQHESALGMVATTPTNYPPGCTPQRNVGDTGINPGSYPPGSVGMPWFRFVHPPMDTDPRFDNFLDFNKTRHLGPRAALLTSPFGTDQRGPITIAGYVNEDGGISERPPARATSSPTRETATASPTPQRLTERRQLRGNEDTLTEEEIAAAIEEHKRELNVFLPDTRQEVNVALYPYRAVGKWRGCTASLVFDSGIVVTNSHCLAYLSDGTMDPAMWSSSFMAGFKNGNFLAASSPKAIWYDKGHDYAVLKLHTYIDGQVGRLGVWWRSQSFFNNDRPLHMISYSSDHCTSWNNCRPKLSGGSSRGTHFWTEDIDHDLDAMRGSSGSAMWNWYNVNGQVYPVMDALNWGENRNGGEVSLTLPSYDGSHTNVAKPAGVWYDGYQKVKGF
jgi:V8-like Glu-specific endopeptidase